MSSTSRIEESIDQILDYIDGCKFQPFSNTKIVVDREEMGAMLEELRRRTPEEIRHYQQIIANKDEILNDARKKAEQLINDATVHTNELINEHAIMQQAYTQANEMVQLSSRQASEILNQANAEAGDYRASAVEYMDGLLSELEDLTRRTMDYAQSAHRDYIGTMQNYLQTIQNNRRELMQGAAASEEGSEEFYDEDETPGEGGSGSELKLM